MQDKHSNLPPEAALYLDPVAGAWMDEALALLGDGVAAGRIESIAHAAGWPMGPLALLDEISLTPVDQQLHAAQGHGHGHSHAQGDHSHPHDAAGHDHDHGHTHHHHDHDHDHGHGHDHHHDHGHADRHTHGNEHAPARALPPSAVYVVEKMAHGFRRTGKAAGGGFYDHAGFETPALWSGLRVFERRSQSITDDEVRDRLTLAVQLAALAHPAPSALRATHFGSTLPTDGATALQQIQTAGLEAFRARAQALADRFGTRFQPPSVPGL